MTEEHSGDEDAVRAVATVAVPQAIPMVSVLGVDDEVLREMEAQFAALDIHVRGDAITISGPVKEVRLGEELVEELIMVLRSGHPVNAESVRRAVALLRSGADLSPSQLLTAGIL
ncbi:MAG: hypothetical protein Q8P61_07905, partial [Candidatus Nanopelagicales bacterium]|nr:hypothetical protein [Candidatus Nanopelagicales bacterium]